MRWVIGTDLVRQCWRETAELPDNREAAILPETPGRTEYKCRVSKISKSAPHLDKAVSTESPE